MCYTSQLHAAVCLYLFSLARVKYPVQWYNVVEFEIRMYDGVQMEFPMVNCRMETYYSMEHNRFYHLIYIIYSLIKYLQVSQYKRIQNVIFVSSIPRPPSGKTMRRELLKMVMESIQQSTSAWRPKSSENYHQYNTLRCE